MNPGRPYRYPPEQAALRDEVRRRAWISIVLMAVASIVLALTLGQSQAMRTAWISDMLTMLPPASLLVAMRFELRPPSVRFPYGYYRAIAVVFLITAASLTIFGLSLLLDAGTKLLHHERPPIGAFVLFGHEFDVWAGWPMIGALAFSAAIGLLIGIIKTPAARALHDKEFDAEAQMHRDEWLSEGAAILGLTLVAFGYWWADAASAAFISIGIIRDGWHNVRQVIADLMDESPSVLGTHELEPLPARLRAAAEALPWVERAMVRLREHGRLLTGEVFIVPRADAELVAHLAAACEQLERLDWRLHGLLVVPVQHLEPHPPPKS